MAPRSSLEWVGELSGETACWLCGASVVWKHVFFEGMVGLHLVSMSGKVHDCGGVSLRSDRPPAYSSQFGRAGAIRATRQAIAQRRVIAKEVRHRAAPDEADGAGGPGPVASLKSDDKREALSDDSLAS